MCCLHKGFEYEDRDFFRSSMGNRPSEGYRWYGSTWKSITGRSFAAWTDGSVSAHRKLSLRS